MRSRLTGERGGLYVGVRMNGWMGLSVSKVESGTRARGLDRVRLSG